MEQIHYCSRCGFCRAVCPTLNEMDMNETYGPRGRVNLVKALEEGHLNESMALSMRIYTCTTCRACYFKCPARIEVDKIMEKTRTKLYKSKLTPSQLLEMEKSIIEEGNPFGMLKEERDKWMVD